MQRKEGKNPSGGLNKKGIASYRRANPGSKLKMAVTTKPSKLKKGSKAANRRKSFCARMSGMKKRLTQQRQQEILIVESTKLCVNGIANERDKAGHKSNKRISDTYGTRYKIPY